MAESIDIISETLLFKGLPEEQLNQLARIAIQRDVQKGEIIFLEEDEGNGFYIVAEGRIKIFKLSSEGKEHILHIFGPGEPFGEVPVFSGQQFPANAEAMTGSSLLFFPRPAFVELISSNPSLALNMLAVLSKRLREFTLQIENLSLKEVPGRLAAYLIRLDEDQGNKGAVSLNVSKGQLASLLGTIPETLSRILANMTAQGLISMKDRDIRLRDRMGLEDLAERGKYIE